MLQTVQVYRAVAVLLVVLYHAGLFIAPRYHLTPLGGLFGTGFAGVFLFFAVSGFIILTAHARDVGRPARLGRYLARRIIRIYPFYWIVLMVWGGWRIFTGRLGLPELVSNALLFEGVPQLIIPVSWTLRYEIIFYALFTALILNRKLGVVVFAGWLGLQWVNRPGVFHALADPMNLLFMCGLGAAALCLKLQRRSERLRNTVGGLALLLGAGGFVATMAVYGRLHLDPNAWPLHRPTIMAFGLSSALLLVASVSGAVNRLLGQWRWLALIGDASYSIYLVHAPFGKLAWNLLRPIKPIWQGEPRLWLANLLMAWVVLAMVVMGILLHRHVEAPLLAYLRGRLGR